MDGIAAWLRSIFPCSGGLVGVLADDSVTASRLAMKTALSVRRHGLPIVFVDLAQSFDPAVAQTSGLDVGELYLVQSAGFVEALELGCELVESRLFGAVIFDAADAISEMCDSIDGDWGEDEESAIRRLTSAVRRSSTPCILTVLRFDRAGVFFRTRSRRRGLRSVRRAMGRIVREEGNREAD